MVTVFIFDCMKISNKCAKNNQKNVEYSENKTRSYNGFDILFDRPTALKKNDGYKLWSQNKGPTHGME